MLQNPGAGAPQCDAPRIERLWRNHRCYCGETVDIDEVLKSCKSLALNAGWENSPIDDDYPGGLPAFVRRGSESTHGGKARPRIYISAGIHGDEPAGPLAAEVLLRENDWPEGLDVWLCPCLNPEGFELNTRENRAGIDLNREYLHTQAPQVAAHVRWLAAQPRFDAALCLHEDWEASGFYVYELNPDSLPSLAEAMVQAAGKVCPVDISEKIEGWPADSGVLRPGIDPSARKDWPEAFYLITHKTRLSYTLESPSDFPMQPRVRALVEGVRAACARVSSGYLGS